jgi:hypothetical protein
MNIYEKIVEISNELRITKDGNNEFKGFKYFRPDDIAQAITPLEKKYKIILLFSLIFEKAKEMYEGSLIIANMDEGEKSTVPTEVILKFDIPLTSVAAASPAQNAGATLTYCKRYMIMSAFNIADNAADPDADQKGSAQKNDKIFQALIANAKKVANLKGLKDARAKMEKTAKYTPEQKAEYIATVDARIKELELVNKKENADS